MVKAVTETEPSEDELQQLMYFAHIFPHNVIAFRVTVDKNKDGKIEWEEFVAAMSLWFSEDYKQTKNQTLKRKNPETVN